MNKIAEINERYRMYMACKGILRFKYAGYRYNTTNIEKRAFGATNTQSTNNTSNLNNNNKKNPGLLQTAFNASGAFGGIAGAANGWQAGNNLANSLGFKQNGLASKAFGTLGAINGITPLGGLVSGVSNWWNGRNKAQQQQPAQQQPAQQQPAQQQPAQQQPAQPQQPAQQHV